MSSKVQQFGNNVTNYFKETTKEATNDQNAQKPNKIYDQANKILKKYNNSKSNKKCYQSNNNYNNNSTSYTNNSNKRTTTANDGNENVEDNFGQNKLNKPQTLSAPPASTTSIPTPISAPQNATVNAISITGAVVASTANDCDKRNFDRITTKSNNQSCSFVYCRPRPLSRPRSRARRRSVGATFENVKFCNANSFCENPPTTTTTTTTKRLNQLKAQKTSKHFSNKQQQNFSITNRTFLCCSISSSSSFYRILFLLLQLSAFLFSFSLNVGFALASTNSISNVVESGSGSGSGGRRSVSNSIDLSASKNFVSDLNDNGFDSLGVESKDGGCSEYGDDSTYGHYTHQWAVHIPNGEENGLADKVAREHGFVNMGKIFDDHFHFVHHKVSKRSLSSADVHQSRLDDDQRVQWSKQQRVKSRQKRDFMRMRPSRTSPRALSLVDAVILNDPKWPQMWYLNRGGGLDMNVIPAWKEGITGKGVVVTILDDGLESDHPDIEHNYDPLASYDVNSHDNDPMPHYDMTDSNRHGTRCAGEVAATANNTICAVGIAFGASVGGVRMLDGDVTDAVEARSLSLNPQHIDIYSASWGPDDDGKTVDGPGELASRAFIEGVTKGRGGKGSIFIWASGNGGRELDNCNCDGYTNSIWTLSISSATEDGHVPWYSEKCSSTLATTYSSGGQGEKQVVTTDLHHSCTVSHTGTSASAPLAAGIAALVLESNRNLTWRDLQHIVVRTAKPANLKDPTWSKNGVGRRISHSFGYGLMDAAAMVRVARTWKTVPEQQRCEINAPHVDKTIPAEGYITLQLAVKHCMSVNYLEHVQAKITLTSQRRGDIQLYLRSPAGTKVTLLTNRLHDNSRTGFNQWPFMSVHTWGESPHGNWQLEIHNEGRFKAQITQWDLIFYGTDVPAQPEDAIQFSSGKDNSLELEMDHNDIEFDASGQWHNMQQIGVVKSQDRTNTACIKTTIDQKCLGLCVILFLLTKNYLAKSCRIFL